jgi:hypothetical protein
MAIVIVPAPATTTVGGESAVRVPSMPTRYWDMNPDAALAT